MHRSLDQFFRPGRTVHIDRLCALIVPCSRHQRTETCSVVIMMMRNENDAHVTHIEASLGDAASGAVSSVNHIERAIHDQEIRKLRAVGSGGRASYCSECDQTSIRLGLSGICLRPASIHRDTDEEYRKTINQERANLFHCRLAHLSAPQ